VKLTRLIRHYAGKDAGIKLGPRISAYRARLATVLPGYPMDAGMKAIEKQGKLEPIKSSWINVGEITVSSSRI